MLISHIVSTVQYITPSYLRLINTSRFNVPLTLCHVVFQSWPPLLCPSLSNLLTARHAPLLSSCTHATLGRNSLISGWPFSFPLQFLKNPSLGFFSVCAWRFIDIYPRVFLVPSSNSLGPPLGFFSEQTLVFLTRPSFFTTRPLTFLTHPSIFSTRPSGFFLDPDFLEPSSGFSRHFSYFFFLDSSSSRTVDFLHAFLLPFSTPRGHYPVSYRGLSRRCFLLSAYLRLFERRLNRLPRGSGSLNRYMLIAA